MNTISLRIHDFLKNIPPFSFLEKEEQLEIAKNIEVAYFEKDDFVFKEGDSVFDKFYLVKEGAIGLVKGEDKLIDECDEGDIFGLRALIRKDVYKLSAKAIEETILYAIPELTYKQFIFNNTKAAAFVIKSFASTLVGVEKNVDEIVKDKIIVEDNVTAKFSKNPVTCNEDTSVENAAQIMTVKRVGSLIIEHNNKPIGILTDKDLRTKIATGKHSIKEKVTAVMSAPVICASPKISIAEAQISMLQHKITHICITEDGTINSTIKGVLSEHDIILIRENNPSVLLKQVKRSYTAEDLKNIKIRSLELLHRYLQQNISIVFISKIISEVNQSITKRAIEIAVDELKEEPPTSFAWISLGSQGRKEQMLITDQDNAIIYENDEDKNTKDYFLKLGKKVTEILHEVGFEYCPAEMMASNTKWCLSFKDWKNQFKNWIAKPTEKNIMLCTIFFDFETSFGNTSFESELRSYIKQQIEKHSVFLNHLAKNALQNPPPLSFFRQFLVEESGEHKNQFDIKSRALMPLVDAARLLILALGSKKTNTIERYELLAAKEPQNAQLYEECVEAYKILLKFRTEQGLKNNDSGRFIQLSELNKLEKLTLKNCFKTIKDIQELLMVRFKLSHFL